MVYKNNQSHRNRPYFLPVFHFLYKQANGQPLMPTKTCFIDPVFEPRTKHYVSHSVTRKPLSSHKILRTNSIKLFVCSMSFRRSLIKKFFNKTLSPTFARIRKTKQSQFAISYNWSGQLLITPNLLLFTQASNKVGDKM